MPSSALRVKATDEIKLPPSGWASNAATKVDPMSTDSRLGIRTKATMDKESILCFCQELLEARGNALRDAEAFDEIIHVVERLGSFLLQKIGNLGEYKCVVEELSKESSLANEIPEKWRGIHIPFSSLYELVRVARNDALHQGAFARHLTSHAIELALVLEDAMKQSLNSPVVGDYMVHNPVFAELLQPISLVRQRMLENSFSFLPVRNAKQVWCVLSDLNVTKYLRIEASERKSRMARSLAEAEISLQAAALCHIQTPLEDALRKLESTPLLVCREEAGQQHLVGILTAFDLL